MVSSVCSASGCSADVFIKKWALCRSHYNRWKYAGDLNLTRPSVCKGCGVKPPRVPGRSGPAPEYCSRACQRESHAAELLVSGRYEESVASRSPSPRRPRATFICVSCQQEFKAVRARRLCSKTCENKYYRNTDTGHECILDGCVRSVVAKEMCDMHYKRWMRAVGKFPVEPWNERRKAHSRRRLAIKRGASAADTFTPVEIYERDSWTCGICAQLIDRDLRYPNPSSASIDHVLPLSKGGDHTKNNVQAAHLRCNVRKGNRVEAARR